TLKTTPRLLHSLVNILLEFTRRPPPCNANLFLPNPINRPTRAHSKLRGMLEIGLGLSWVFTSSPIHSTWPKALFVIHRFKSIDLERRKRPATGLLLSSYFTLADNREGVGETYDLEADLSSGVHQQTERPTA
ncbi:hypothetical protein AVEN_260102-1, partial [Araneus ventricosus]